MVVTGWDIYDIWMSKRSCWELISPIAAGKPIDLSEVLFSCQLVVQLFPHLLLPESPC